MKLAVFKRLSPYKLSRRPSFKPSVSSFLFSCFTPRSLLLILLLLPLFTSNLWAWPADGEWNTLLKGGSTLRDTGTGGKTGNNDASGSSNIVSDVNLNLYPSAYIFNDGTYLFYRLRLDSSPAGSGGQGVLQQFGWGVEIDSNQNPDNYEWLIMVDGIASPETVNLQKNTVQTSLGDPSDVAEITVAAYPLPGNHRILPADSSINGDQDFFLDFRIPYDVFLSATGLGPDSMIRYFVGTSKSANNLTNNGADLLGGSDLYDGLGDYLTPGGATTPCGGFSDGKVSFVNALDGFIDVQLFSSGNQIYLRVDDADQTLARNPLQTVRVAVTTPRGDSEVVTLNVTGVAGKFSGELATRQGAISTRSNTLDMPNSDETVTVTYLDAITATCTQNIYRTDTILSTPSKTDLHLVKTVSNPAPTTGNAIIYTLTLTNLGPNAASNFTVTDPQPTGIVFGAVTPPAPTTWNFAAGTGTWTIPALASGASITLSLPATVTAAAGQRSDNIATINYANDGFASNNSSTASTFVQGTDLRVTKSVSDEMPAIGSQVTYTLRVFNLGPYAVNGVTIDDLLPVGVSYVSHNASVGTYSDVVSPLNGLPDTWNVGSMAIGDSAALTIVATVTAAKGSTVINTATLNTATLSQPDINSTNNSDSASFLTGAVDLEVVKTANNYGPMQNDTVLFTVQVSNNGPNPASGVALHDILPAGLTYLSHTTTQGDFTDTITPLNAIPETWNIGALAKNASATLTITVRVTAEAGTTIRNDAIIASLDQHDIDTSNNSAFTELQVGGTNLGLVKLSRRVTAPATTFAAVTLVQPNDRVEFQLVITNYGPAAATNVAVTDILPANVSLVSSTATLGSYDGRSNGTKVWTVGNLAVNANATLTLVADVDSGATGTITNVAMITGSGQLDTVDSNNISSAQLVVNGTDLGITKSVSNSTPLINSNVTYTIAVTNYGPIAASTVQVIDLLPPELTFVSANPAADYNSTSGLWTIGTIGYTGNPITDKRTLTITATVKSYNNDLLITNAARVSADQSDQTPANNQAISVIAVQGTDISLVKNVSDATPAEGDTITYTVDLNNIGVFAASNVEIEDLLPAGLTQVSATPSAGSFTGGLWYLPTLAANGSATLQIVATVQAGTHGTTITNTAQLHYMDQIDSNLTNNSSSVSIVPFLKSIDLQLAKTVDNGTPLEGNNVIFTLTLTNLHASLDASGIAVTDTLPAGLTFVSATPSAGSITSAPTVGTSGEVAWSVPTLSAMSNVTLTIIAKTACGTGGTTLINSANISAKDQVDPDNSNNSASASVTPTIAPASLTIVKMANTATANSGETIIYTIQTLNSGCGAASNVVLSDRMSPFTAWSLHAYGVDTPFKFTNSVPDSGLTLGTPLYSNDDSSNWVPLTSGGGGAPAGFDGTITNWQLTMNGNLRSGGSFTLNYQVQVK